MRTLVTGGAGFIGSNLVDALLEAGHEVTVLDDFSSGREENLEGALTKGVVVVRSDIRVAAEVDEAVREAKPEAIFHLAAQMDVRKSIADPAFDARTNVEGTVNVLEAARSHDVARVINISTGGAIYGDVEQIPTPEGTQPRPEAPYGQSKYCAECYCGLYSRLYGLSTITLRFGNVYGPRQDPHGEAGVVAIFCGKLRDGGRPKVFGTGEQTRDYVFVGDVVEALLAALGHPEATGEFNVGTGDESSVLDLIEALAPLAKEDFSPELAPARTGELDRSCLDVAKARDTLGFTAQTPLDEGLRRTAESFL